MNACVLCAPASADDLLFEDDAARVLLHPDWSPRGHLMIVAREHVENAADLDEERWLAFARVWHRTERILLDLTGADRSIAVKLGILTPHLHVHLHPVPATATREEVFAWIDAKARDARDESFVAELRGRLTPGSR
ncbi:MAG TPA: HIT domain-containing protein [Thermoanaerobaculia bacterium]|jgi:diadenosine tetraphosphate (Ap4A) HIT family hydrolase|nr:HIT domain-containing protein [Thermoanaerobaculia bacterium]